MRHRRLPPVFDTSRARKEWGRTNHVDHPRWRRGRQQRQEETHDGESDFLTPPAQELSGTVFLQSFQSHGVGTIDEAIRGLNKVVLQLLDLDFFFGPIPSRCGCIDGVNVLMILDQ